MKHPEFEKLINAFEGKIAETEKCEILAHTFECRACSSDFRKIERFFEYSNSENLFDVAQDVTARLLNIYQPTSKPVGAKSGFRKLFAQLVFDDWQIAVNERLAFSDSRQMLFKAENYEIDFRLNFSGDKCQVRGQVFPDCAKATAVISSGNTKEEAILNEYCEFIFPILDQGNYKLTFMIEKTRIEITDLSLIG